MSFNPQTPSLAATAAAATSPADQRLLQTLMGRLHLHSTSFLSHPLDDLLLSAAAADSAAASEDESDDADADARPDSGRRRRLIAKEEAKLEKEIIRVVLAGNAAEALKANSGQSVAIGDHNICVGVHEDPGSEYRVWEWHGHIMFFDDEDGYSAEYIYGNYFEKLSKAKPGAWAKGKQQEVVEGDEEDEEGDENCKVSEGRSSGLKDLIAGFDGDEGNAGNRRVVRRNSTVVVGPGLR